MLNRVILMGRLVSDPELKTTTSGISVTSFRIAVDRSYVKAGAERQADFFDIVAWRNTAEFVCRNFGKGSLIAVDGQLQSRQYQAKDGTNRTVIEVVADNVSFTGERRDQSASYSQVRDNYSQVPATPVTPSYSNGSVDDFQEMPLDDDLPF
ncbi:MAG: single-stranded DNA-binding protein [Ruminococcus sp.]|nr:single-stranded DNA-binding protein [Ruminococcus sp.]